MAPEPLGGLMLLTDDGAYVRPLSSDEARGLTARLREALAVTGELLLEAFERRAWVALGYASWGEYVHAELQVGLGTVRRRMDQVRLTRALSEFGTPPVIPLRHVPRLMACLDEILDDEAPIEAASREIVRAQHEGVDLAVPPALSPRIRAAAKRAGSAPDRWLADVIDAACRTAGA